MPVSEPLKRSWAMSLYAPNGLSATGLVEYLKELESNVIRWCSEDLHIEIVADDLSWSFERVIDDWNIVYKATYRSVRVREIEEIKKAYFAKIAGVRDSVTIKEEEKDAD